MTAFLTCVLLYAGLLRVDALFKIYGPYDHPRWLAALQPSVRSAASNLTLNWRWRRVTEPYVGGDPVNYLKFAREMRSFYAAHAREPGFPGATRLTLMLTGDADVAVSLTSIGFALLTLGATVALGSAMGSPVAGLAAAAALGIDQSAVYWAVGGWRDEMFAFFAVLSVWAWLRLTHRATYPRAAVAGLVSAGALLTRITSLSFLAPAAIALLIYRRSEQANLRHVGVAVALATALTAPFMINCAIATGDPFFAINHHTDFYLKREGTAEPPPISALQYTVEKFTRRPIAAADTVATGIFLYPFENKWVGLDAWQQGLGQLLACLAAAGLVVWLWQRDGRLILLMFVSALIPFSVTWTVRGGAEWRLTLFAYPFQLLAAFWLVEQLARRAPAWRSLTRRQILQPALTVLALTTLFAGWALAMPYAIMREALTKGYPAGILSGHRDWWFFDEGWSRPVVTGNVVSRFATAPHATARLLLPESRWYTLVLRLHPLDIAGAAAQPVDVALNGRVIGSLELTWNANRVGEYRIEVPAEVGRPGINRLTFLSRTLRPIAEGSETFEGVSPDQRVAFRFWYIRIEPR